MWRSQDWLRRAGSQLSVGLVALGQCLGAYVPAECYGFQLATRSSGSTAAGGWAAGSTAAGRTAAGRTARTARGDGGPPPGHPERLVPTWALVGPERAAWRRLEELWERDTPRDGGR
ncbi:DUF6059 family protein [Streptomyces sp. NPDC051776]|uniref:DUF6059 family protein n=1 Tax=Streptomyces sp. NPDC051776 TaxID=3155414 RepID=UPI00342487C7